jgi:hypothetical protein
MGRGARLAMVAAGAGVLAGCLFQPASNYAVSPTAFSTRRP